MVGSGRKRKKLEKAKTQLKKPRTAPGRHLPKGTNEMKTNVKVAKIVIPGQKGESAAKSSGPVTNKRLGLKDVLSKISHFSIAVRTDGLEGLKELVSGPSAASLVSANLSSILAAIMPVAQDRERKLRKLANSSVASVLAHTPGASLAPLHALLTAHLCCALTHIDPRIQQDGLTTLDCLLDQAPAFIRAAIHQLLPNCLDQISAKKKPGDKKVSGPAVAANLSESMSSLQWRLSVLTRIDRLLEAVSPSLQTSGPETVAVQQFLPGRSYSLPRPPAAPLPLSSLTSVAASSGLQDQALLVLPLLIETWVEARALEEKQKSKSSVLPREVAELLACVSGILDKMLRLLGDKELAVVRKKFEVELVQHLLVPLPYSCPDLPCAEANTQLASVSLALGHSLPLPVLQAGLKCRGASAGSRLRLVTRLLEDPALAPELRGACVAALVQLLDTAGARERQEATRLLREEAVKRGGQEVRAWVRGLAGLLAAALEEGGDRQAAGPLLESCLALAKTRNTDITETFLAATEQLSGAIRPDETSLVQQLAWTTHHCRQTHSSGQA